MDFQCPWNNVNAQIRPSTLESKYTIDIENKRAWYTNR